MSAMGDRAWKLGFWVLMAVVAFIFIGGGAAAFLDPSQPIETGHCYRIVARSGILGYMAGSKHIEITCP